MKMPTKKLNSGFELPELGLGTWKIGGSREVDNSRDDISIQAIRDAIDLGYTHIDTAEGYGLGHCEELIGKAIKHYSREKLTIATKVTNTNLKYDDLISAAKNSLQRLNTDYIDIYYIHAPSPSIPLQETMRAMDRLVSDKLIINIAVSNFTADLLEEAQSYTSNKIVANQIEYSLLTREDGKYANNNSMESKTIPYCQKNDIFVVAERPLERGILLEQNYLMDELVKKYNKSYAQIAINWLLSQDNIITIPKSEDTKHLKENLGGTGWYLDIEDIERLRKEYNR